MSENQTSSYKADLRALRFTLWEHLRVQQLFDFPRFSHVGRDECDATLEQAHRIASEILGPLNAIGDRRGCGFERGKVTTPPGFRDAWKQLFDLGITAFAGDPDEGGLGAPLAVDVVVQEMLSGANTAFNMYPGLTRGNAEVVATFGTSEQKARFLPHLRAGRFSGTMCLSEPHAGSDVGAARTSARQIDGDLYSITGTKCWISAGDHDLTENVVHLVLARVEDAPPGTKGLSLFIVPKVWVHEDGSLGEPNDVATASIEHKLGIRASATAVLSFGENGKCRGFLVGGQPNVGIKQMFLMMNNARIAVGLQGIALASTAYLNALDYARQRLQGSSAKHFKDPNAPRVPIIEHSDVRRMLMEMKGKVEGMRTLAVKLAFHSDCARALGDDPGKAAFHQGRVDLLTPILKAYCADQAFRIAELAIQTYGGAGYVQDHPVEQYLRDAKIFSIYEGTNHIQAADLVARKLPAHGGASFAAFVDEIVRFVDEQAKHPGITHEVQALRDAVTAMQDGSAELMDFFMNGNVDQVTLVANAFLEIMAEVAIAHLLLEAAVIADAKRGLHAEDEDDQSQEEFDFYSGKVAAAKFFANYVLPGVHAKLAAIRSHDRSLLDMPDAGF
ncbi:MAG TPA: acyl-CoA dehydrogenase [Candidatus Binatia bacterium]|nr:acyl-CoA dehydrogenase [Candidatus Binatia bacterium]